MRLHKQKVVMIVHVRDTWITGTHDKLLHHGRQGHKELVPYILALGSIVSSQHNKSN